MLSAFFGNSAHCAPEWDSQEASFDASEQQASVTHEFKCVNRGESVVKIVSLKPSCPACVSATADRMTLQPGETGTVKVAMDRKGRGSGQQESVLVKTDDGQEVRLAMLVLTDDLLTIRPPFVWWKHDEAKTPKELIVEVKVPKAGVKTLTVTANTEAFDTEIVTEVEGARYRLRLTPKTTATPSVTTFTIKADAPKSKPATVLGYAKIL